MTLVVIGSGLAGYLLVKELRDIGYTDKIQVFTKDSGEFYSKPQISNAFALNKTANELVSLSGVDFSKKYNIELFTNTIVQELLIAEKQVVANSQRFSFTNCVLATGANVKKSLWGDTVYYVNNLVDYTLLRSKLSKVNNVAIIGAGLVGCELAADFIAANFQVSLFNDTENPIQKLLPDPCGKFLKNKLLESGISWYNSKDVSVKKINEKFIVNDIEFDLVISALGIEPNVELAVKSGIKVNNGIVVDGFCETSVKGVYALGDCASVCGSNLAYIAPIRQCVNILSKVINGEPSEPVNYPAMPVILKTPMCKTIIQLPSLKNGDWKYHVAEDSLVARFENAGKLTGFIIMGNAINQRAGLLKEISS